MDGSIVGCPKNAGISAQPAKESTMTDPRISLDADGTLDDFAAVGVKLLHFEALDQSQWYLTVELNDGAIWQLKFGARNDRAKGYAFAEQVQMKRPIIGTERN
jgi:hypothetical protein